MKITRHGAVPFVGKARRRGGLAMAEAVEAADAALDGLIPSLLPRVRVLTGELLEALASPHPAAVGQVRSRADLLAGCTAAVGLGDIGRVAASLCRLIDISGPLGPSRTELAPFADTLRFLARTEPAPRQSALLLAGLDQISRRAKERHAP